MRFDPALSFVCIHVCGFRFSGWNTFMMQLFWVLTENVVVNYGIFVGHFWKGVYSKLPGKIVTVIR